MKDQGMKSVQKNNFAETFHLFYRYDRVSKQVISDNLGHSLPTITSNLKKLLNRELIVKDGAFLTQKTGRPAQAYKLNESAFTSLGMELFGNYITIISLNARGELSAKERIDIIFENTDTYYKKITDELKKFVDSKKLDIDRIVGLGIGIQGLVSDDQRRVVYSKILPMADLTTAAFQKYLPFPVTFLHDADAVALAEQHASKRTEDAIYLSIGEHLGTAMMVDGKIYNGARGRSGTMEHITIAMDDNRLCYCGRHGCIETYVAISTLIDESTETLTSFFDLIHSDDSDTLRRWHQYLNNVAEAIVNLHMFADSPIILAGEITNYLTEKTIGYLEKRISQISAFPEEKNYLELGEVHTNPVAFGAALPLVQRFIEEI